MAKARKNQTPEKPVEEVKGEIVDTINEVIKPKKMSAARKRFNRLRRLARAQAMKNN